MTDLAKLPTAELTKDLADSVYDIYCIIKAMEMGGADALLKDRSLVATRAGHNLHFVNVICKELLHREYKPEPT